MKYCRKLFKELNFEPNYISPCCDTQKIKIPSVPYAGGEIDLEAYSNAVSEAFNQIQSNGSLCRGCREIREIDALPAMNGKFANISINMHRYFCNCKCEYCDLWSRKNKGKFYEVLPGLKSLKRQNALEEDAKISWGGGEPSILPEFDEAAKWLCDNNYYQYIHTSAIKFSPSIDEILKSDKGKINVSLDCGGPSVYRSVKGVDKFDAAVGNIKQYASANPANVELKYIIYEKNNDISEIRKFVTLAKEIGVKNLQFSFDFREQNAGRISQKSLIAAAFLIIMASAENINFWPFFVDEKPLAKIKKIVESELASVDGAR